MTLPAAPVDGNYLHLVVLRRSTAVLLLRLAPRKWTAQVGLETRVAGLGLALVLHSRLGEHQG